MTAYTLRSTRPTPPTALAGDVVAACFRGDTWVGLGLARIGSSDPARLLAWQAFGMQSQNDISALHPSALDLASRRVGKRTRREGRFEDPVGSS
ncbi:MAG TPA: hypothetical protein PLW10_16100 [Myxococcota bacterium]|nr:hypothetical protein [Myxococcota bacterium]